jgi:hypothetical protein
VAAACGLTADPGGPYTATRVDQVTLDGSHSHAAPDAPITSYQWTWKPGAGCPPAYPLAPPPAASAQPTLTIRVLCGLRVTLTVTDKDGHHASDDTTVTVQPRGGSFAETKASYSADLSGKDKRLLPSQPEIGNNTGTFSLNVDGCPGTSAVPADDEAVFCPYVPIAAGRNHNGNGYEVAVLHDGAILASAKPSPGAKVDFYAANKAVVLDFLTALNEHEGDGDGRPGTGHTEVMAAGAGTDEYNINKWLEASIRSTPAQLGDDAEVELAADERELFRLSRDPLVPSGRERSSSGTRARCAVRPTSARSDRPRPASSGVRAPVATATPARGLPPGRSCRSTPLPAWWARV